MAEAPGDEVDGVVEAWRRERPDLGVESMAVWSRIHRLSAVLDGHRKQTFSETGLETWEFDVLAALRRAGAPYQLSPGQLVQATHVTSGTMTNRIDRLRTRGLVTRTSHPSDRRVAVVTLTDEGRAAVDAALTGLLDLERALLGSLDPTERHHLAGLLRKLSLGSRNQEDQ